MSFFGDDEDNNPLSDKALLRAVRQRILSEIENRNAERAASIINNYSGAPQREPDVGGVSALMGQPASGGEDPFDYFVDIARKDLPVNPETGKPAGWEKKVHRYRHEKKKDQ